MAKVNKKIIYSIIIAHNTIHIYQMNVYNGSLHHIISKKSLKSENDPIRKRDVSNRQSIVILNIENINGQHKCVHKWMTDI